MGKITYKRKRLRKKNVVIAEFNVTITFALYRFGCKTFHLHF